MRDSIDELFAAGLLRVGLSVVTAPKNVLPEEGMRTRSLVTDVDFDRCTCPLAGQAKLAPGQHIGRISRFAGRRENGVELGQGESLACDRIVWMNVDRQGVERHAELDGRVAEALYKSGVLGRFGWTAHRADVGHALDEARNRRGRTSALMVNPEVGMEPLKPGLGR